MTREEEANYNLAKALLVFKDAYAKLVAASERVPDFDISEQYPFFLLDFEKIAPAVAQWCTVNATKLLRTVPADTISPLEAK